MVEGWACRDHLLSAQVLFRADGHLDFDGHQDSLRKRTYLQGPKAKVPKAKGWGQEEEWPNQLLSTLVFPRLGVGSRTILCGEIPDGHLNLLRKRTYL